jgi:hypothetical protein
MIVAPIVLAALACAAPPPAPRATADTLAWLAGSWAGAEGPLEMEESWTAPRGGTLLGVHRDVKEGRTVGFEFLRIQEMPEGLTYWASPGGGPATPFRLKEAGERRVVFENLQHDFPQRILYWIDAEGALRARIEGPQGGKTVGQEWRWTRR